MVRKTDEVAEPEFVEGYYWARHNQPGDEEDLTTFVVLLQDGHWFCCGIRDPINDKFDPKRQIIGLCPRLDH